MHEPTPRRERERQQHIKHILNVAESLFATEGFFRVTMRRIALDAEFALGTIYSYFGSKNRLYKSVIESRVNELIDVISEEMTGTVADREGVKRFIAIKLSFLSQNPAFLRLFLAEIYLPRRDNVHILPAKVLERYDSMLRNLTGTIEQGIRKGVFKPMKAEVIAKALDGLTNAFALSWLVSEKDIPIEADIETVTELFFHGAALDSGTEKKSRK